eukprot:XP_011671698.1 PREDICTED: uncharacterized protein LOC105441853 [Strongylocentrotus purpuratus]
MSTFPYSYHYCSLSSIVIYSCLFFFLWYFVCVLAQNVPSSSWLGGIGGFWSQGRSPADSNSRLNESGENECFSPIFQQEKDTLDTESLESIEVLSMTCDNHSDKDIHPHNHHKETPDAFDPQGVVGLGTGWNRHSDVAKPMCSNNVVSPVEGKFLLN